MYLLVGNTWILSKCGHHGPMGLAFHNVHLAGTVQVPSLPGRIGSATSWPSCGELWPRHLPSSYAGIRPSWFVSITASGQMSSVGVVHQRHSVPHLLHHGVPCFYTEQHCADGLGHFVTR